MGRTGGQGTFPQTSLLSGGPQVGLCAGWGEGGPKVRGQGERAAYLKFAQVKVEVFCPDGPVGAKFT